MRDIVVTSPADPTKYDWTLDIDIIAGFPRYVDSLPQTQDQRAAVSAYIEKGTIPGNEEMGIDWGPLLSGQSSLVAIDNELKKLISQNAAIGTEMALKSYIPMYDQDTEGGIGVTVYRT